MISRSSNSGFSGPAAVVGIFLFIIAIGVAVWLWSRRGSDADEVAKWMITGKTFYEKGEPKRSIDPSLKSLARNPSNPDVNLNLANAFLAANQPYQALTNAAEVLHYEPGSAAAHYLM